MRLHRFYTTELLSVDLLYRQTEHLHQWRNVFRYTAGQEIVLFGDGFEHMYIIKSIDKKSAELREISKIPSRLQPKSICLAVALIKKENFELLLEKCTELGVTSFRPIITDHSLKKIYNQERFKKILIEASEQSGWGYIPALSASISFDEMLLEPNVLVFDTNGAEPTQKLLLLGQTLCIGPEGGWSERERTLIRDQKVVTAVLSTGILRAETAAIVIAGLASIG